jgi:hypothetical protein
MTYLGPLSYRFRVTRQSVFPTDSSEIISPTAQNQIKAHIRRSIAEISHHIFATQSDIDSRLYSSIYPIGSEPNILDHQRAEGDLFLENP